MLEELKEANEYILKKIKEKDFTILQIEQFAKENNVPIITKEVAKYLEILIESYNVKKVLEIGTAIGYSGGLIAKILDKNGGDLTTIEIDEKRYHIALENFRKMGIEKRVNAILGDANEVLKNLNEIYDFVSSLLYVMHEKANLTEGFMPIQSANNRLSETILNRIIQS